MDNATMTNKQAAETLREIKEKWAVGSDRDACERGAEAIEMLEWLRSQDINKLFIAWNVAGAELEFIAYCEALFRERVR